MGGKGLINSRPKPFYGSRGGRRCRVCANPHGIIRKYHLDMCRQCFRERALDIGFMKVNLECLCKLINSTLREKLTVYSFILSTVQLKKNIKNI